MTNALPSGLALPKNGLNTYYSCRINYWDGNTCALRVKFDPLFPLSHTALLFLCFVRPYERMHGRMAMWPFEQAPR